MKACLPVAQHVTELCLHRPCQVFSHQVTQVSLPRDKADQWNGSVSIRGFHQLHQLGALTAHKTNVCRMAGQPQHQLIQEQDDRVVTQRLRMAGHDAQAIVERYERLAPASQRAVCRKELADEVTNQARSFFAIGGLQHGSTEAGRIPAAIQGTPTAATAARAFVELGKKDCVANLLAHAFGIFKQAFGQVEARYRCVRVQLAHKLGVLAQDGALHVSGTNHVIGHQQKLLAMRPTMSCDHTGQFGDGPCLYIASQHQVQHGHEVALTRAKTAMQVGRFAAAGLHRLLDKAQRVVKGIHQLRGDHIVAQGGFGVRHTLRQLEHKITLVHSLRDVDQVFK